MRLNTKDNVFGEIIRDQLENKKSNVLDSTSTIKDLLDILEEIKFTKLVRDEILANHESKPNFNNNFFLRFIINLCLHFFKDISDEITQNKKKGYDKNNNNIKVSIEGRDFKFNTIINSKSAFNVRIYLNK